MEFVLFCVCVSLRSKFYFYIIQSDRAAWEQTKWVNEKESNMYISLFSNIHIPIVFTQLIDFSHYRLFMPLLRPIIKLFLYTNTDFQSHWIAPIESNPDRLNYLHIIQSITQCSVQNLA